eukprot:gb/GFBE01040017.1/.p1 GENE.gb/GFBE01040017.1/~~gb/GFBE01040017.1/.p1  ORF type:complete len:112 (+),score=24.14 gb/GFBE01040017.1/:1-336(+)
MSIGACRVQMLGRLAARQGSQLSRSLAPVRASCSQVACLDPFEVLNLSRAATLSDVTDAYHRLALRWLPEYDLEDPESAQASLEEVLGAYEVLTRQLQPGSGSQAGDKDVE